MWLRLHRPPKKVRRAQEKTAKERWLFERSLERYNRSSDGLYLSAMAKRFAEKPLQEIGRLESIRFIES